MIERADTSNILNIVIIATSDLHGNLWGYRYEDGVDTTNDGWPESPPMSGRSDRVEPRSF